MGAPRDYTFTFAGAGTQPIQAAGRHLRIVEAPVAAVFVALADGSEIKRAAGQGVNVAEGFTLGRISIRSAVAQTVRVLVADEEQPDNAANVSVSVAATIAPAAVLGAGGDVSVAATSSVQVIAGDATRLSVTIANPDSNVTEIRVGGVGVTATKGVALLPGDSITLATTAAVYVYNPHSSAQNVQVLPQTT